MSKHKKDNLKIHFVVASGYYGNYFYKERLDSFILKGMKKYKMSSVMVTNISMTRDYLITKETMESYCRGEKKFAKESVNDGLERFFEDLQHERDVETELDVDGSCPSTYFLPKLTRKEMKLAEKADLDYFSTFTWKINADVKEDEMKLSESKSKFESGRCFRNTYLLEEEKSNWCSIQ